MINRAALYSRFFVHNVNLRRYNFQVPTPFYHLSLAEDLIGHPYLPRNISIFLQNVRCEFLFGNTAPDVQVISSQPRDETHFFSLPIRADDQPAWELFLSSYPHLAAPEQLQAAHAAFVAGYLCHLQADWMWIKQIFTPIFGPRCSWGTFPERLYYHNVLRAYLDQRILPGLCRGMDACLSQVRPDGWLPFVDSGYLAEWRDFLGAQLEAGATPKTVEVFSARQGIAPPEYYTLLGSEERMQREVFDHIPLERVQSYRQSVLVENSRLLTDYLAFALHQSNTMIEGNMPKGADL